jgi:hypothetical protein
MLSSASPENHPLFYTCLQNFPEIPDREAVIARNTPHRRDGNSRLLLHRKLSGITEEESETEIFITSWKSERT